MIINYFGTNLDSAGHYFWELEDDKIRRGKLSFKDIPFDPEGLPKFPTPKRFNGFVGYSQEGEWTVIAIEGSCYDKRPASKSVFFIKGNYSKEAMKAFMLELPIILEMIRKMSFSLIW